MQCYFEAPEEYQGSEPCLFLAGGVTGCPDWQNQATVLLQGSSWVILNPRRAEFPMDNPSVAEEQIRWEHRHLRRAQAILFWFPCETLCPIALYELGAWSMTDKPLFVGIHPDYQRRQDVEVQTRLVRPDVTLASSLEQLVQQVRWYGNA